MAGDISQFFGVEGPVTSIVNYYSSGGVQSSSSLAASAINNTKETLSGPLTANTLSGAIVNVSGRGRVNIVTAYTKDATARTVRLVVIVDGATIFDAPSSSISNSGYGLVAVGNMDNTNGSQFTQPIRFNSSFVVKLASSLTETDKIATGVNYELW